MKKKIFSMVLAMLMVITVPLCASATLSVINTGGMYISQIQAGGNYMVSNSTGTYILNNSTMYKFDSAYAKANTGPFCWNVITYNSEFNGVHVYGGGSTGFYYVLNRNIRCATYNSSTSTWTNSTLATIPTTWSTDFIYRMQYSSLLSGLVIQYRGTLYVYKNSTFQNLGSLPVSLPEKASLLTNSTGLYITGLEGIFAYNLSTSQWYTVSTDDCSDTSYYTMATDGVRYIYKVGGAVNGVATNSLIIYDPISAQKTTSTLTIAMKAPMASFDGTGCVEAVSAGSGNLIQN